MNDDTEPNILLTTQRIPVLDMLLFYKCRSNVGIDGMIRQCQILAYREPPDSAETRPPTDTNRKENKQ